jgi:hypothetical protein
VQFLITSIFLHLLSLEVDSLFSFISSCFLFSLYYVSRQLVLLVFNLRTSYQVSAPYSDQSILILCFAGHL